MVSRNGLLPRRHVEQQSTAWVTKVPPGPLTPTGSPHSSASRSPRPGSRGSVGAPSWTGSGLRPRTSGYGSRWPSAAGSSRATRGTGRCVGTGWRPRSPTASRLRRARPPPAGGRRRDRVVHACGSCRVRSARRRSRSAPTPSSTAPVRRPTSPGVPTRCCRPARAWPRGPGRAAPRRQPAGRAARCSTRVVRSSPPVRRRPAPQGHALRVHRDPRDPGPGGRGRRARPRSVRPGARAGRELRLDRDRAGRASVTAG